MLANGAMGLALEMFPFGTWFVYVGATVFLEAWYIGRGLKQTWPVSLLCSLLFNGLTALCVVSECYAPFLHEGDLNPHPLLHIIILLVVFNVISGWIEAVLWSRAAMGENKNYVVYRSVAGHLLGVPVALVILLFPSRPYKTLEMRTFYARRNYLREHLSRGIENYVAERKKLKKPIEKITSIEQLVPYMDLSTDTYRGRPTADGWACLYNPQFSRFSLGENKQHPFLFEFHTEKWGKILTEEDEGGWATVRNPETGEAIMGAGSHNIYRPKPE